MTTQVKESKHGPMITPKRWVIIGSFVYAGVSYSQGEPVPKMPVADAQGFMARGAIAEINEDGEVDHVASPGREPRNAAEYLNGTDISVFRKIRQFKPDPVMLRELEQTANRHARSMILVEALRAMLGDPL